MFRDLKLNYDFYSNLSVPKHGVSGLPGYGSKRDKVFLIHYLYNYLTGYSQGYMDRAINKIKSNSISYL